MWDAFLPERKSDFFCIFLLSLVALSTARWQVILPPTLFFHFFAVREKGESHKEVKWSDTNLHIHWMCFFLKVFFGDKNGVCHILMRWYFAYSIFRKCVPIMWLLQIDRLHVYDDRDVFLFFAFFVAKLFERGKKMDQIVFGSFV